MYPKLKTAGPITPKSIALIGVEWKGNTSWIQLETTFNVALVAKPKQIYL